MFDRVRRIISEQCDIPEASIQIDSSPLNTPNWDSLATLRIVMALETEMGVSVTTEKMIAIRSVADILALVDGSNK